MKEFLPIDSAPCDVMQPVLAWREVWELPRWVHWCRNPRTGTEFWNDWYELDAYELELEPPTHWLPMPPYPTSKANTLGTPTRWRLRRRA